MVQKLLLSAFTLLAIWIAGFFWFIYIIPDAPNTNQESTDAIAVLTGGKGRLIEGISLLSAGRAKTLLITGVGQNANIDELQSLSDEVIPTQVKPLAKRITLGHLANNTKGNAEETALWMDLNHYRSLRIVTSNYHMPRSMLEFRLSMPGIKLIPHPVFSNNFKLQQWWSLPGTARLIFLEYNKYLWINFTQALWP